MNILYLASVRIPNEKASGLAIMRQCEAFSRNGHGVTLLRPHRVNHITEEPFTYYGLIPSFNVVTMKSLNFIEKLGKMGFFITRTSQMVASLLYILQRKREIDLIYARDPWLLILPLIFCPKIKIIWEAHQMQTHFFVQFVAKKVQRVVCISKGLQRAYAKISGRDDILFEPSGVDVTQFDAVGEKEYIRDAFGIPREAHVIGYIGKYSTMGESKGVDELLEAFAQLQRTSPETHLLIVGLEFNEKVLVENILRTFNVPVEVTTLLPLEQKHFAEYVQAADILVMNYPDTDHYRNYMSPTKLFAYMASNKLIVASDLPTVREIADESMLIFTKPSNVGALKDALLKALSISSYEREELTRKALVTVRKYSWQSRAERILSFM